MKKSKRENKEDSRLVEQAQADKEAFGDLYQKYFRRVTYYIKRRLRGNGVSAEDLAQETFLRAFKHLSSFSDRGYSYLTYLLRISHNLLVNMYRKKGEEPLSEKAETLLRQEATIEEEVDRKLTVRLVREALTKIPEDDRNLLNLFYKEERSIKEIAGVKKTSANAVKLRLSRARKRLAKVIADLTPPRP